MNKLSAINGYLSRIDPFTPNFENPNNSDIDVVVTIGGERFVMGKNNLLLNIDVEYNVRGGGICKIVWANNQVVRVGAPIFITIGIEVFWSGIVINGKSNTWQAEPLQSILDKIYFYDNAYDEFPFAGTVTELINIAFNFAQEKYPLLQIGKILSTLQPVEYDVNNRTISDILQFCGDQFENAQSVWGVDNNYLMFFNNIGVTELFTVREGSYSKELKHSIESDNIVTVFSVFKNKEVKIVNTEGGEVTTETIYPMEYLGKVGIGNNDITGGYFPAVKNYYLYGYKEERHEIDAPKLDITSALEDAYNILRKTVATEKTIVESYKYDRNIIPIGARVQAYTQRELNISFSVPIGVIAVKPAEVNGAISIVEQTPVNEGVIGFDTGSVSLSKSKDWIAQIALVDNITEISIGYTAKEDGVIILKSAGKEFVQKVLASDIQNFASFINIDIDKKDVEIFATANISLISLYARADYGATFYEGYLRSVRLKSSAQGNFYDLTIFNYGALPVLTFQRLQEQIRNVESVALRG